MPYGTGIPKVKQGDGKEILANTKMMTLEIPYRAFYFLWEYAERIAEKDYRRYLDGPMANASLATLEAAYACRNAVFESATGSTLPLLSESDAQKIRAKEDKPKRTKVIKTDEKDRAAGTGGSDNRNPDTCPKCGSSEEPLKKKGKDGRKLWKCFDCDHRWAREPSTEPSEARKAPAPHSGTRKRQKATQRSKQKAKK